MSLINKMLQDLETRQNPPAGTAPKKAIYEDLKPVSRSPFARAPSRRLITLLLLVGLIGGGAYAWMEWGDTVVARLFPPETSTLTVTEVARKTPIPKPAPTPVAAASNPTNTTTLAPAASPKEPPAVIAVPSPAPAAPPVAVAQAPVVPAPSPEPKTAVATPVVEPKTNPVAKPKATIAKEQGYWTVARGDTLYGISLETGIELWDLSNWNGLGREHVIHPGQKLRLTPPTTGASQTVATRPPKTAVARAAKEKSVVAKAKPVTTNKPESKLGPVVESSGDAVMDKRLKPFSPNEKAESEYRRALAQLDKGRAGEAEKILKAALQTDETHTPSRELLAGLMLQQGHWHEAEQLLQRGIDVVPSHYTFAKLLARVYVEHGSDQKALAVMEGSHRAGEENPDYMALLAALYQRVGKHADAVKAYQQAITLTPHEGRWWVGMGISLEAVRDWKAATGAYQRALETGTLEENLIKYARSRLGIVSNK